MAHTHEFDCPICGAHIDSRDELNRHTERAHSQQARGAGGSSGQAGSSRNQSGEGNVTRDRDTRLD